MTIRPYTREDLPAIVELRNQEFPDFEFEASDIENDLRTLEDRFKPHFWLAEEDGVLVGTLELQHDIGSFHEQKWNISVIVKPEFRQRGYGSELLSFAKSQCPNLLEWVTIVRETCPEALTFAEKNGFVEDRRLFVSELDVSAIDLPEYVQSQGEITFHTLAERSDDVIWQSWYETFNEVRHDIPRRSPPTPIPFDIFLEHHIRGEILAPDYSVYALENGRVVGFANCFRSVRENSLDQGLTAVARSHRGTGLAQTLKKNQIHLAKKAGITRICTDNDSTNAPMLAINRGLGFQPQPSLIMLAKTFEN